MASGFLFLKIGIFTTGFVLLAVPLVKPLLSILHART